MSGSIVIAGMQIRRDHEGRFCINDLHRASGGEKRHQPSNWLALQQTQALIGAIERAAAQEPGNEGVAPMVSRQGLGTFGAKSLVYAYAMWISPEFNLRVIEAYDELQMQRINNQNAMTPALPDFSDPVAAARAWADEAEKVQKLASLAQAQSEHLQAAMPAVEFHAAVQSSKDSVTIGQFAKLMSTGEVRFFELLRREKILITGGARHNLPFQQHIDTGRFRVNESTFTDDKGRVHLRFQTRITPKGQLWLQRRFFPQQVNAISPTPDMFALQLPHISEVQEAPAAPARLPAPTTLSQVEEEVARLRELRRTLVANQRQPMSSNGVTRLHPVRAVNDGLGQLAHPSQDYEAALYRQRPGN